MGSVKSQKNYLHVSVYWGGAELGSFKKPLSRVHGVTAGKGLFSEIKSVVWPRWDKLEIIRKTKSGLILNPNIPWDGVVSTSRGSYVLRSLKPIRKIFEMTPGTSASLRLEDMSIAIRVGPQHAVEKRRIKPARGFAASPFSLIADQPAEWAALAIAAAGAAVITFSARSTLMTRDNDTYQGMADLPAQNLMPFIAQKHLAEGPNVIQFSLDRFNYVHNVWDYYSEFARTLGFGEPNTEKALLFGTTADEYKGLFEAQEKAIKSAELKQQKDIKDRKQGQGVLSVPTVTGESIDGKILRVLDKISVFSALSQELTQKRVEVAEAFEKDMGLKKDEKEAKPANEAFEKITQGYLGIESDDKMQESMAKSSAAMAALAQIDLFGEDRLRFGAIDCCQPPAGAPLTQSGFSWLSPFEGDLTYNQSVATLKGSTWGSPVKEEPTIQEPMVGHLEPALVEKTITAGRYQLRLCYELALRRNQAVKGSMEWRWQINSQGLISNIDLLQTSIKDDELVRCVHDKIANWKFPKPRGGSVEVRYPFEFSRDKG